MSLGVCLPGGGAKGAFQAGVLEALYDRGIKKYDSYACTSIGAMNGYYLYTENVDKMKKMWISEKKLCGKRFKSVDNIMDNSEDFKPLYELKKYRIPENSGFYINYLQVRNKIGKEIIVDISKFNHKNRVDYIKYSCALPYHQWGELFSIKEVKEYIKENYKEASLENAAVRVSLSPSYLSRIFKEKCGMGFSDYLTKTRMEKACELLGDIKYKSYDIAYYIGYDNPKNFSRAFKAYFGMTPKEYRNGKVLEKE